MRRKHRFVSQAGLGALHHTRVRAFIAALSLVNSAFAQDKLVWSDEFNGPRGSQVDASKWTFDEGYGKWGNHEDETYCAPQSSTAPCDPGKPNVYIDGEGHLVIRASRNNGKWTSGRLKTAGKEAPLYGRIEARMKLPQGTAVWPAFWLLGADIDQLGWPRCGEIDVMENVPMLGADSIQSTIHGPKSAGAGVGKKFNFTNQRVNNDFHTYGVIWESNKLAFYVDDPKHPFYVVTKRDVQPGDWVYEHPFFLLLNLAIGGDWPGHSDATTPDPTTMLIDYVRVYQ